MTMQRCEWAGSDPLYIEYHDNEWGIPEHDDRKLFEMLILEGAQAGLSWITILKKRQNYRTAFDNFKAEKVAKYDDRKFQQLMANEGIVRNNLKINAAIENAKAFLRVQKEFGTFDTFIWQFVDGQPEKNAFKTDSQIPAKTIESEKMSIELRKRDFRFVGPTICYAFMQAVGMVNDHVVDCFRYNELAS